MIRSCAALTTLGLTLAACGSSADVVSEAAVDQVDPPAVEFTEAPATVDSVSLDPVNAEPSPSTTAPQLVAADLPPAVPVNPTTPSSPAEDPAALGSATFDLPGCPDSPRAAVTDKASQRYWLCKDGIAVTDEIPMTTASSNYGLPPVGTYEVFAREADAFGIGGEALERFVAFYTTPKGNRIAFHEVVNQDPATVGDLDQRGSSAGCFRVREADSIQVWEFLQIGDPVVVLTN